eukprot:CAMPEP_0172519102 /NCGR_PEP_ID=MMETSP1066-20121228/291217_1 /TAXON_ID=671091 /ORGANISM="Coscinodiscus wailesii, Strain CCMP2513" /LENGTH=458 /DNA_ID=CAMNT_0013301621 /DNA_START=103 /DNA_END=1476 /DNA_ORIENTATION=-
MSKYTILMAVLFNIKASAIDYGVDVSFPIHHEKASTNYAWLPHNVEPKNNPIPDEYKDMPIQHLPDRQTFYQDFLQGCIDYYGDRGSACIETERDRVAMSLRQPQSMVNYTDIGFKKIRAPEKLFNLLSSYWEKNKGNQKEERWNTGNTYTNHWAAPTKMVSVEDTGLRGGGFKLKQEIWNAAKDTIEEWTGNEIKDVSLYGIRVYTEGAVLAPHVDRMPLISSAIVNVAQDVDEDWPLEVYGRDGKAYNVTMQPGDMVLYESHSLLHGRPFPLKGRYFANIFIHFEPIAPDGTPLKGRYFVNIFIHFEPIAPDGNEEGLPMYIMKGSLEESRWYASHPNGRDNRSKPIEFSTGSTAAHRAAQDGDMKVLQTIAKKDESALIEKDSNGWQPLHEAARAGHTEVIKMLIEFGADVNERANFNKGGTALYLAEEAHGSDHPAVALLRNLGGLSIGPEFNN